MKNFSPQEEQLIKESAEWFNRTITKIKSRKDPYRKVVTGLMDDLSDLIDDIDGSLYQLSKASEKVPNFEYSSSFTVSTIKDKIQAFSYKIAFLAEDLARDEGVKRFVETYSAEHESDEDKLRVKPEDKSEDKPEDKPKNKAEKPKEKLEKKLEEIDVKEPAKPGNMDEFITIDDMVDTIVEIMYNIERIYANINTMSDGIIKMMMRLSKIENIKLQKVTKRNLKDIEDDIKKAFNNPTFASLKTDVENIIANKNNIIKNKRLSNRKYSILLGKYNELFSELQSIRKRYLIMFDFMSGQAPDLDVPPPPEEIAAIGTATTEPQEALQQEAPQQEAPQQEISQEEDSVAEAALSGNIIIKGTSYTAVVDSFLQKYATKPSTFQRFMTALNTMLMQLNATAFRNNKAKRILKFRESLMLLKEGVLKIMGAIKSTAGVQGDPQKEISRWNTVITDYNNFADLYNKMIHSDISSRLSSLNQDLIQERALSMSSQSMVSRNNFNMASNSAKRNYQPSKFVINKLPNMETLVEQYVEDGKIWGMKKPTV